MSPRLIGLTAVLFALACAGTPASADTRSNEDRLLEAITGVQLQCPSEFGAALSTSVNAMNIFAIRAGSLIATMPTAAPEGLIGSYNALARTPNIDRDALAAAGLEGVSTALSDECRAALLNGETGPQ